MNIKILLAAAGIVASLAGLYTYHNIAAANNSNKEEIAYRQEMGNLICDIKEYGQEQGNRYLINIAQAGARRIKTKQNNPPQHSHKMKAHLDGVMVESVNYGWDMAMDNPTPVEDQEIFHDLLAEAKKSGVVPLVLDYCREKPETQKSYREDRDYGYLGWVSARRDLDRLPKEAPNNNNDRACTEMSQAKN